MLVQIDPSAASRSPRALRILVLATMVVLAAAACSPTAPAPPQSSPPGPTDIANPPTGPADVSSAPASPGGGPAAQLLLEVRSEGGFINPAASIGSLPLVVVDADGRIYTRAAPDGGATLVPQVLVRDTGAAGAAAILAAARAAGLADGSGAGGVAADTGSTVFTLELDGTEVVTRVAPGGPAGGPVGGPGVQPGASGDASPAPGATALDLLAKLGDPTTPWGNATTAPVAYRPSAYRVWVAPMAAGVTDGARAAWPLPSDPNTFGAPAGATLGVDGLRSGVVDGAEATALGTALAPLDAGSTLSFAGHAYQVWVRPLLPDELGG
jgi:hypothetical protein